MQQRKKILYFLTMVCDLFVPTWTELLLFFNVSTDRKAGFE